MCISASNGSSAHLLKVGSKRRRTQADLKEQLEAEELASALDLEKAEQIAAVEQQLKEAAELASKNKFAADALTEMVAKGQVVQEDDGALRVVNGPNVIMNESDVQN